MPLISLIKFDRHNSDRNRPYGCNNVSFSLPSCLSNHQSLVSQHQSRHQCNCNGPLGIKRSLSPGRFTQCVRQFIRHDVIVVANDDRSVQLPQPGGPDIRASGSTARWQSVPFVNGAGGRAGPHMAAVAVRSTTAAHNDDEFGCGCCTPSARARGQRQRR